MTSQDQPGATAPMTIAVIGATGFVGNSVVSHLARAGHRVVALSRDGGRRAGWPDSVETRAADVASGAGLSEGLQGADAAVHLVAIPRQTKDESFAAVNVRGTQRAVESARGAGVRRFVHLSALGVIDDPKLDFLYSKWLGEQIVRDSDLEWVVLRPSLLFGPGDGFFSLVRTTLKWWSPGIVAIPGDGSARFQPLAVDDLAVAVERSLVDADRAGSVYELGGPEYWTYRQIVDEVMKVTGMRRFRLGMPIPLISALTSVTDRVLPIFPVSHDQIQSLQRPNSTELDAFVRAFGIEPRPFDVSYLGR
ncbi:MAG: complex I NDUFA9 subunit family protein [Chloroflexi bacterium]|nr:complex I NDUFA9 subunit family protein [Chloroflexota bacterium]